ACGAPMPGTGSIVHLGSALTPPARSTPRQNSRPCSAVLVFISHLPRRISSPPRVCRDVLSLHEKGVGGEHGPITHRHAVMDERANPDRAAGTNRGAVGFERAVLLRVALDFAEYIEHKIGRASCRERVERYGGVDMLEKK